ncbi:MAG TPA: ATP-binding protein [Candidatus Acidoferrum sp.]|nr:ATP-binding protein [Candidatus Acidoferrum sp.]
MANKQTEQKISLRQYKMTVAGQLFKHLGLQMYSGAVPAISELISNAYDAMAKSVWITIPTGRPILQQDEIVVRDDGRGMTFEECNSLYLSVGRNRRSGGEEWTTAYNGLKPRRVQGRKGIGKLAGFGIADRIGIRTVKDKQVSHFALDFPSLTKSPNFADEKGYFPEALSDDGVSTDEDPRTTITLAQLKITRAIDEEQFKRGLARRLLILDKDFTVHINGQAISRMEIPFQFRFPEKAGTWETADLGNGQQIQWWAGFCKDTIPDEEQRGFVVYVRGKLAQTPWFFDLSGGVWGQHGMQYLTGEVKADFLDDSVDLIATDRGTIRWEDPIAVPFKDWGRKKIRDLLENWTDKRREAKAKSPKIIRYLELAENLPEKERKIFKAVVDRITAIPQLDKDREGKDIADELVEFAYNALTNRSFLEAIRQLNAASMADVAQFAAVLSEWDIIEAVNTAHLVKGRVEIIRKFEQMIKDRVPEKPDMQDYVRDRPWLIDPKWTTLVHEQSLDRLLREKSKIHSPVRKREGARRLDFFCLGDRYQTAHVVEAKRPGDVVGRKEFDQLRDYVLFLRRKLQEESTDPAHKRSVVKGLLIADRVREGDEGHAKTGQESGVFDIRTWENLLTAAEAMHKEFLDAVKMRAPADDPRMKDLEADDSAPESASAARREHRRVKKRGRNKKTRTRKR